MRQTNIVKVEKDLIKTKLVRNIHRDTWARLKAIAAINSVSIADTIKELVEYYLKNRELK